MVDPALQEFFAVGANVSSRVKQSVLCLEEGLGLAQRRYVQIRQYIAQMLLRKGGTGGTHRNAQHTRWFAGPSALPLGARGVVNRVLENARDRSVVFGRHEQKALSGLEVVLQAKD